MTAQAGTKVTIVEVNPEALKKAETSIQTSIQRVAKKIFKDKPADGEKFIKDTLEKINVSVDLKGTVANTDLVIEAIIENMGAKHKLFAEIDAIAPKETIFASNTSSLPIGEIASVTQRKDRFGGLHFFNPVPVMKLLEVIRIPETSEETYQTMMAWGQSVGKTCITCKDTPGFVVNRLLVPNLAEAVRMLERGDATARDIDTAMKLGAGYPMGPFELADYVGLDTTKFILDGKGWLCSELCLNFFLVFLGWSKRFPDNPLFKPIPLLTKLVEEGKCGIKSGEGFYNYKKQKI